MAKNAVLAHRGGSTLVYLGQVGLQGWARGPLTQMHNGSACPNLDCWGLGGAQALCCCLQEGDRVLTAHCL